MSLVRALAISFAFAAQATGALELFAPCCEDDCPEDNDEGLCPPSCASCAIAKVSPARVARYLMAPVELAELERALGVVESDAPDGVRGDVFHPPRA